MSFVFLAHKIGIRSFSVCGRCPHLASGMRPGFSGNTPNAEGIGLPGCQWFTAPGFLLL